MGRQSGTHGRAIDSLVGGSGGPGDDLKENVDRKQEELAQVAEVADANFLGHAGEDWGQARPLPILIPPAGSTKAWTSGSMRAGTRTNKPQGRAGEKMGTGSTAPWEHPSSRGNSRAE